METDVQIALKEQSDRHHKSMSTLTAQYHDLALRIDNLTGLLAGTLDRTGLVHEVATLKKEHAECRGNAPTWEQWLRDRGTKILDALLVAGVVLLVANGFKLSIRDVVGVAHNATGVILERIGDSSAVRVGESE